jgi:nitroreductase
MELKEAIYGRRAIRDFADRPVARDTALTLLQAAVQAPSAVNAQPWAFAVIQDKARLRRYSDRAKAISAETGELTAEHAELQELLSNPEFNIFYNANTLIVICAKPIGRHPEWDCYLAGENLMLCACDLGLGTCPIGLAWPLLAEPDIKQELQIPAECAAVLPIIVGYPSKPGPPIARRDPDILCWR